MPADPLRPAARPYRFPHLTAGPAGFRLDAPGNLLLCGEYAVTEEGGQGIWLAPEAADLRRAVLWCRPAAAFRFRASWPDGGLDWRPTGPGCAPPALLAAVLEGLDGLAARGLLPQPDRDDCGMPWLDGWEIELDTGALFDASGRKLGLGSSAAACLLLSAALLWLQADGLPSAARARLWTAFPAWAAANHRRFQGGRGSGYDVFCSLYGGLGRFTGGREPQGEPLPPRLRQAFPSFRLLRGPAAVRTTSAIAAWRQWRDGHDTAAAGYIADCTRIAARFCPPGGPPPDQAALIAALGEARHAGQSIGEAIGIAARLPEPLTHSLPAGCFAKALGAGNETILLIGAPAASGDGGWPGVGGAVIRPARHGLRARPVSARASARGKLLLFGEHAALHGLPAVGTPLDAGCRIAFCPGPGGPRFPNLPPRLAQAAGRVLGLALASHPGFDLPPGGFFVDSGLPAGSGYGSSAAFSAALVRTVRQLARADGWPPPDDTAVQDPEDGIWLLANRLDGFFHGRASGIDTGLALFDRPCAFLPDPEAPLGLRRVPVAGGRPGPVPWLVHACLPRLSNTRELVGAIGQGVAAGQRELVDALAGLGRISQRAIAALSGGSGTSGAVPVAELGRLADRAQALLAGLGLSTPMLERALELGRAAGAAGGKLSGAGGGGAFYLWAEDEPGARRIATALAASGLPFSSPPLAQVLPVEVALDAAGAEINQLQDDHGQGQGKQTGQGDQAP